MFNTRLERQQKQFIEWQQEVIKRVRKLPESLREVAFDLLAIQQNGEPFSQKEGRWWDNLHLARERGHTSFNELNSAEIQTLLNIFSPTLSSYLWGGLKMHHQLPYQNGYSVAPFRSPNTPSLTNQQQAQWLTSQLDHLLYRGTSLIDLFDAVGYEQHWWGSAASILFAAAINSGTAEGDTLFAHALATNNGTSDRPFGNHVIHTLLWSSRQEGWEAIERLLLAAQREEGLRDTILRAVPHAPIEAFARFANLIANQDLTRFNSVVQALNGWLGTGWEGTDKRQAAQSAQLLAAALNGEPLPDTAEAVFVRLNALAFQNVDTAIAEAKKVATRDEAHAVVVALFLGRTQHPDAAQPLIHLIDHADLRVASRAVGSARYFQALDHAENELWEIGERNLKRFPKQTQTVAPLAFSWLNTIFDYAELLTLMVYHADLQPLPRVIGQLEKMNSDQRGTLLRLIETRKAQDAHRDVVIRLTADRSGSVRKLAFELIKKLTLTAEDMPAFEVLLKRKAETLRRAILEVLLQQSDADVLISARRLLASSSTLQRQAGLELLRQMQAEDRQSATVANIAQSYGETRPQLSNTEQALLANFSATETAETASLQDGLGLYDPDKRTPAVRPKGNIGKRLMGFFQRSFSAESYIHELDQLVEQHQGHSFQVELWNGEMVDCMLGDRTSFHFPNINVQQSVAENCAKLPLADVWLDWWAGLSAEKRGANDFFLYRLSAYSLIQIGTHHGYEPAGLTETVSGALELPKQPVIRHWRIIRNLIHWLLYLVDPQPVLGKLLDLAEHTLAHQPVPKRRRQRYFGAHHDADNHVWLHLLRQHRTRHLDEWQPEDHGRFWRLCRWYDQPAQHYHRSRPAFATLMHAYDHGAANDHDLFDHLIGVCECDECQKDGYPYRSFHNLSQVSRRRPDPKLVLNNQEAVAAAVEQIRLRVREIEVKRGDLPTNVASIVYSLTDAGGMSMLLPLVEALGNDALVRGWANDRASRSAEFSHLIRATSPLEGETVEVFVTALNEFNIKPAQLVRIGVFAPQWAQHIEAALGWPSYADAVWWLHAHTKDDRWNVLAEIRDNWTAQIGKRTPLKAEDLMGGAVDVQWFWRVYNTLGSERWTQLDKAIKYTAGGMGHKRAQLFADAMRGQLDEDALVKRADTKGYQDGMRAIGLLPLPDGDEQEAILLQRYLALQGILQTKRKRGPQKRANEKRAVEIGIANLARTAGYPDPLRLEWAMERHAVADLADGSAAVTQAETTVTLRLDFLGNPVIDVEKKGRVLKNIPAKLKKLPEIKVLVERRTQIRKQAKRMRKSLEEAMVRGDQFSGADLTKLFEHPVLRPMLEDLVFVGESAIGYLDGEGLVDYVGSWVPISAETTLRIAHPHDLFTRGDWHEWQRDCFRRERIQPFKQIFRELYVTTPAELEAGTHSARYAGQQVNPKQAYMLLSQNGWLASYDEAAHRTFHDEGLTAWLDSVDGYYIGTAAFGDGTATLGTLHFTKNGNYKPIPLDDVPPRVFSTTMRDLDLVVSVAHAGGVDPEATGSTVEMRAQLALESAELLKLSNIQIKGKRIWVEGALNTYTIHLGSGVIHQQPGGYLCIVPVSQQRRGRVFLPFVDDDPKSAEIIAKMIMLTNDSKIKDPTILNQIQKRDS